VDLLDSVVRNRVRTPFRLHRNAERTSTCYQIDALITGAALANHYETKFCKNPFEELLKLVRAVGSPILSEQLSATVNAGFFDRLEALRFGKCSANIIDRAS